MQAPELHGTHVLPTVWHAACSMQVSHRAAILTGSVAALLQQ